MSLLPCSTGLPRVSSPLVALFCAALLAGCGDAALELQGGGQLPLEELRGRTLVLNYWAVWCAPCREEIPVLNALDARDDVVVLGVDFDRHETGQLEDVLRRMDIQFAQLAESAEARWNIGRPTGLPVTYIIDGGRRVVTQLRGPQTAASLEAALPRRAVAGS